MLPFYLFPPLYLFPPPPVIVPRRTGNRVTDAMRCTYIMLRKIKVTGWAKPFWTWATTYYFGDFRETQEITRWTMAQHHEACAAFKAWLPIPQTGLGKIDWVPHRHGTHCNG